MDFGDEARALFGSAPKQPQELIAPPGTDIARQESRPNTGAVAKRLALGSAVTGIAAIVVAQPASAAEVVAPLSDESLGEISAHILEVPVTFALPDYQSLIAQAPPRPTPIQARPTERDAFISAGHEQTVKLGEDTEPASVSAPLSAALDTKIEVAHVDTDHMPPAPLRFVARAAAGAMRTFSEVPVIGPAVLRTSEIIDNVAEPLPPVAPTIQDTAPKIGLTILSSPAPVTNVEAPLKFVTRNATHALSLGHAKREKKTNTESGAERQRKSPSRAEIMADLKRDGYKNGRLDASVLEDLDGPFEGHQLHKDVVPSFLALNKAFKEKFGHNLKLNDSYRSYKDQIKTKKNRGVWAAAPGTSKHGWGIAVDIDDVGGFGSEKYNFLRSMAGQYGWDNPKGLRDGHDIDEYWHFEYFGTNFDPAKEDTSDDLETEAELPPEQYFSDLITSAPVQTTTTLETVLIGAQDAAPDTSDQAEAPQDGQNTADDHAADKKPEEQAPRVDQSLIDTIISTPVQTTTPDAGIDPSQHEGGAENNNGGDQAIQPNALDATDGTNDTQTKKPDSEPTDKQEKQEHKGDNVEYSKETLLKAADRLQQRGGEWTNRAKSMRFFIEHDLKPIHAAGITGNFMIEGNDKDPDTDINPRAKQGGGGPGRGIAQWTESERWRDHLRFCEKRNLKPWSMEAQLQFAWHEMEQGGMVSKIKGTTTIEDAVYRFERDFERAGKPAYKKRNKAAHTVYDGLMEEAQKIQNGQ